MDGNKEEIGTCGANLGPILLVIHVDSAFYDVAGFKAGRGGLTRIVVLRSCQVTE